MRVSRCVRTYTKLELLRLNSRAQCLDATSLSLDPSDELVIRAAAAPPRRSAAAWQLMRLRPRHVRPGARGGIGRRGRLDEQDGRRRGDAAFARLKRKSQVSGRRCRCMNGELFVTCIFQQTFRVEIMVKIHG